MKWNLPGISGMVFAAAVVGISGLATGQTAPAGTNVTLVGGIAVVGRPVSDTIAPPAPNYQQFALAGPARQEGPSSPVPASAAPAPASAALASPVPVIGGLVRNGGSLARWEMQGQANPNAAGIAAVSFFYVAAPQPKTLKKHDLVTIIVNEQSAFSTTGDSNQQHKSDLDLLVSSFVQPRPGLTLQAVNPSTPPEFKTSLSRDFISTGVVDRSDSLTARITAEVADVKPNGTLLLQASKTIRTDDEDQIFVLTGICRVEDIGADNTISSSQLFNLSLAKTSKGQVHDTTERGFTAKLLDSLNPF